MKTNISLYAIILLTLSSCLTNAYHKEEYEDKQNNDTVYLHYQVYPAVSDSSYFQTDTLYLRLIDSAIKKD